MKRLTQHASRLPACVLILLILSLVLVACGSTDPFSELNTQPNESLEGSISQEDADDSSVVFMYPATTLEQANVVRPTDHVKGTDDPDVLIIEYGDFQCPGCGAFSPIGSQIVEEYGDNVQMVFRHFPLDSIHPNAIKAAEASEAAGAQGKFWEYHDLLFADQVTFSNVDADVARQAFIDFATQIELDVERFTEELDAGTYTEYVMQSQEEAVAIGVSQTPSAILNGALIAGLPMQFQMWQEFIESEIALKETMGELVQFDEPPEMTIDEAAIYLATVEMAKGGTFVMELYPASAPQTVNSFVFLSNEGWFDGVIFHRVLDNFVAQTGDPTGTGRGGPGYMLPNEIDPSLSHAETGMVAMANSGPDTNGSQWYITLGDAAFLDGGYTVFGRVVEGMDVVSDITLRDPAQGADLPDGDVIKSITISEQ